jgi:hypothetical protein
MTIVILYFFSFLPKEQSVLGIDLRYVDIFSDLKEKEETDELEYEEYYEENYEDYQYEEYYEDNYDDYEENDSSGSDNSESNLIKEEINYNFASFSFGKMIGDLFFENDDTYTGSSITDKTDLTKQKISGNVGQLKYFFDALKTTKTKKVRIAHYGDSAIEGDLITADIRENLQDKFDGNGVGFISITSQDVQFRQTTKHSFSNTWSEASLYSSNPKRLELGISGEVFIPEKKSWVEYQTTRRYRYLKHWSEARLLYKANKNSSIEYSFDGGGKQKVNLKKSKGVDELTLKPSGSAKKLRIEFQPDGNHYYGVMLENGNGLYVDNFPLRGNSGVDLQNLSASTLKEFGDLLNYKLIILEFGLNAAGSIKSNYRWYEREMEKVINNMKKAFPTTSILMISVHDKSMKKGTDYVTDPSVIKLLKSQIDIARKTKVAFWNLFEAMGGKDSMPKWVDKNWAFKDYIHFNDRGAKEVADLLSNALIDAYNNYKRKN